MAEDTGISWTDHTFNPWWGCVAIAPGCDNCYASALDARTGGNYWNAHQPPRRTKANNWRTVLRWHEHATITNRRLRVFCGSMMDWCDKDAPAGAREELFELIRATPMLDWQLLTKRATRIAECLPDDWGDGYDNVWLGVTCEDIRYGYPRLEALRSIPARLRFVSAEPLLEALPGIDLTGIDWVIVGGESGPGCRPMAAEWATDLIARCDESGVSVWFKQHGGAGRDKGGCLIAGAERKEWPNSVVITR